MHTTSESATHANGIPSQAHWDKIYTQQDKEIQELRNALEDADHKAAELEQDMVETREAVSELKEENGLLLDQVKMIQFDILNAMDILQENLVEERKMREIREKELSGKYSQYISSIARAKCPLTDAMQRVLDLEQQFSTIHTGLVAQAQRRGRPSHSHYSSGGVAFTIAGDPLCNQERHAQITQSAWDAWGAQNTRYTHAYIPSHSTPQNGTHPNAIANINLTGSSHSNRSFQGTRSILTGLGVPSPYSNSTSARGHRPGVAGLTPTQPGRRSSA
jgi:hypothetical protein